MTTYPSIFNDVIGPVMRGPASSHCAASLRIGRICRDLMDGESTSASVGYDPNGSLATTHKGQGSDMGLFSGFLGWEADDERLPSYLQGLAEAGLTTTIDIRPIGATHPNTYQLTLHNASCTCGRPVTSSIRSPRSRRAHAARSPARSPTSSPTRSSASARRWGCRRTRWYERCRRRASLACSSITPSAKRIEAALARGDGERTRTAFTA